MNEAIAAGALAFIVKPFEAEQVAKTVDNVLSKKLTNH